MKNIKPELDDSMRAEYKRSDFGEIVRGKFATTPVDFAELTALLLAVIGEDDGITFTTHSVGNYLANHRADEWTYEIDNANQITLRYWLDSLRNVSEEISNPACVLAPNERTELLHSLIRGVTNLKAKLSTANK